MPDSPKICLLNLLEAWVQRVHEHTLAPTLSALETALNSKTVGLGPLISELGTSIIPNQVENKALPYFVASLILIKDPSTMDVDFTESYSKNIDGIEAKENGSVLLEMQVSSEEPMQCSYQWNLNGFPLSEDGTHAGTTSPMLCWHRYGGS